MAPNTTQVSSQLRHLIFYHLDSDLYQNALFLAGRLQALEPRNPDAFHLLALCHLRLGQNRAAYDYSRQYGHRGTHLGCSYIFAQACLALGRNAEGAAALERARPHWESRNQWNQHSETTRKHLPDAAAVYNLLGKLLHANGDVKRAVDCYDEALKLNPFMWDAFERLCDSGAPLKLSNVFKTSTDMLSSLSLDDHPSMQQDAPALQLHPTGSYIQHDLRPAIIDPFNSSRNGEHGRAERAAPVSRFIKSSAPVNVDVGDDVASIDTPPTRNSQQDALGIPATALEPPNAPLRAKSRTLQGLGMEFNLGRLRPGMSREKSVPSSQNGEVPDASRRTTSQQTHKRTISGSASQSSLISHVDAAAAQQQRKSDRIRNKVRPTSSRIAANAGVPGIIDGREIKRAKAPGTKGRSINPSTVGRVVSGNRKPIEGVDGTLKSRPLLPATDAETSTNKLEPQGADRNLEALQWLLDLFGKLGKGYFALSRYQCQEAILVFNSIVPQQRDTPWVLAKMGIAHFEQTNYVEAEKLFARLKKMAPSRLEDMEIYSTVLWHLKNDTELAFLSYELVDADRTSAQAWCTIGNSFSLQRDHDQAIKCFKRATQLDPKFAYGYTLQGHEHMSNEEYDKALLSYRKAINAESRHYNGWYGLGKVYEKLGQYELAEKHFKIAADINPTNSVLMVCIGVVQEKLRKTLEALDSYDAACVLAPHSGLARFKRARALMNLQRNGEALVELNLLKDMVPDEANVHFMLGRLYKNIGDKANAVKHYTVALNLDPKAAQYIKEAMEAMDDDDDEVVDDDEQMS